jgi:hypothetical protein
MGLAAVLWRFLAGHESCVANHCAVPGFDIVTTVPSTSGWDTHPVRTMTAEMVGATRDRYRGPLTPEPNAAALGRTSSFARYSSTALWGEGGGVAVTDDAPSRPDR